MIYLIYCISFELILLRASGDFTICRRQISSLFYGFWEKHVRKGPNSANFQNLIIFNSSSNFNASLHLNIQLNELFYESVKKITYYTPVSRQAILCDWVWRASGVHTGFRTITLVLYIGSLPNLTTWFPCGRERILFILGSLDQRSRSLLL